MRIAFLTGILALASLAVPAAAQESAAPPWVDMVVRTPEGGYRQGNPDAPVKLIEYSSRNCPFCALFANEGVPQLRAKYIATGKISYEFRDFLVYGAPDFAAALLNQCAPTEAFFTMLAAFFANQNKFLDRTQALYSENPALIAKLQSLPPTEAAAGFADALGYLAFAGEQGLPEAQARACLADPALMEGVARVNADAVNRNLPGTPLFMINGKVIDRATSWSALEPLLKVALR